MSAEVQLFPPESAAAEFLECLLVLDEYVADTADAMGTVDASQDGGLDQDSWDNVNGAPDFTAAWQIVELGHNMLIEYWAMKQAFDTIEEKMTDAVADLILPPSAKASLIVPARDHLKKGGQH